MAAAAPRIAILGGGVSGLSLAHFMRQAVGPAASITILEGSNRLGGLVESIRFPSRRSGRSYLFERGTRGITKSPDSLYVFQLIQDLQMEDEVLLIPPHGSKRYIYTAGDLHPIPTGPMAMWQSPLVQGATAALIRDRFFSKPTDKEDESVYDFFHARFGDTIVKKLLDPIISGTFGADLKEMSMAATFGHWYPLMQKHGSVMMSMALGANQTFDEATRDVLPTEFIQHGMESPGISFASGTEALVERLAESLELTENTHIVTGARVTEVASKEDGAVTVCVDGGKGKEDVCHDYTHVVSTLPADCLADILPSACSAAKEKLEDIPFSSCWVVNLGYSEPLLQIDGLGYSVPTGEDSPVMRVLFDSNVFPQQATDKDTRISVTLGREFSQQLAGCSMEEVANLAADSVAYHLQNKELAMPDAADAVWIPKAYAISPVGHKALMASIRDDIEAGVPGMQVLGIDSTNLPSAVSSAYKVAKELGRRLRLASNMDVAHAADVEQDSEDADSDAVHASGAAGEAATATIEAAEEKQGASGETDADGESPKRA